MKKVLVIGAGTYQVPAIQHIKAMGHEAYCVDYLEDAIGYKYADGHKVIDVKDKCKCLDYAKELNIDGVITWGATLTLATVNYICSNLSLPCLNLDACNIAINKYEIRNVLVSHGLNHREESYALHSLEEINNLIIDFPFVVKPCDGSGSKGVIIVQNENEIINAIKCSLEASRINCVYVEPFINGPEYTVETYSNNGKTIVCTILKTQFEWVNNVPIYKQTTYLGLSSATIELINEEVTKAVQALNINCGPCNFDIIVSNEDGKPYIIDVGIRNGQNLIASHIIPYSRGIDELDCTIRFCLGKDTKSEPTKNKNISSRLLIYNPGTIVNILPMDDLIGQDHIVDIIMRKKVGDVLPIYHTKSDICGWVLTDGDSPEDASRWADKAWEKLKNYIIIK